MRRSLLKYFIRYGVLFIYCMVTTTLLCNWLMDQYRGEVIASAQKSMETAQASLLSVQQQQDELSLEIYFNTLTRPAAMRLGELRAAEGINQLATYRKTLAVNDLVIAFYEEGSCFTQDGRMSLSTLWNRSLKLGEESQSLAWQALNVPGDSHLLLCDQSGKRMLLSLYTVPNEQAENARKIGFVLREKTIADHLRTLLPEPCAATLHLNGQTIAQMGTMTGETLTFRYPLANGLQLDVAVSTEYIFADFEAISRTVIVLLVLSTVLLAGMLWRINVKSVKPIHDLSRYVQERTPHAPKGNAKNELEMVQNIFAMIYEEQGEQAQSRKELSAQMSALLTGGFMGKEKVVGNLLSIVNPTMKRPYHTVFGIRPGDETLYNHCCEAIENAILTLEEDGSITLVAAFEDIDMDLSLRRALYEIIRQGAPNAVVATGRPCYHLRDVATSFAEMQALLAQRTQPGLYLFEEECERDQGLYASLEAATSAWGRYVLVSGTQGLSSRAVAELEGKCGDPEAFEKVYLAATSVQAEPQHSVTDDILAYIDQHYCDAGLSLDALGQRFLMSGSNVSKQVKAKTGQTYNEYVSIKRMNRAKELLSTTELTMQEIVGMVGYGDASSFTRKFKTMFDETPSEYRARMK